MEEIRLIEPDDINEVFSIYCYYIENTVISFEIVPPALSEFTTRVITISNNYPWLVYVKDNKIIGYAYGSKHREREAYQWSADVSVYLHKEATGKGIGTKLYKALFTLMENLGYYNLYAGISLPNEKSIRIHEKFGFSLIGIYKKVGFKFNRWIDVGWWVKSIKSNTVPPEPPIPIKDLPQQKIRALIDF